MIGPFDIKTLHIFISLNLSEHINSSSNNSKHSTKVLHGKCLCSKGADYFSVESINNSYPSVTVINSAYARYIYLHYTLPTCMSVIHADI